MSTNIGKLNKNQNEYYSEYLKYKKLYLDVKHNMYGRGIQQDQQDQQDQRDQQDQQNERNQRNQLDYKWDAICSGEYVRSTRPSDYPLFTSNVEMEYNKCSELFKEYQLSLSDEDKKLSSRIDELKRLGLDYTPLITNSDSVNRKLKSVTELINELDHYKHMFTTLTNHLNTYREHIGRYDKMNYVEDYFGGYDPIRGYTPVVYNVNEPIRQLVKGDHTYQCIFNYLNSLSPEMLYHFLSMPLFIQFNDTVNIYDHQLLVRFPNDPENIKQIAQFKDNIGNLYSLNETRLDMLIYLNSSLSTKDVIYTSRMHNDNLKKLFLKFDTRNAEHVRYLTSLFNQPSLYLYRKLLGIPGGRMSQLLLIGMFELYIHLLSIGCMVNVPIDYYIMLKILTPSGEFIKRNVRSVENVNLAKNIRDMLAIRIPVEYQVAPNSEITETRLKEVFDKLIEPIYVDMIRNMYHKSDYKIYHDDLFYHDLATNLASGPIGLGEM